MIQINNDTTFADCERLIERCLVPQPQDAELKLATNIHLVARPGGAVSLVQALITWARAYEAPRIITYAKAENDDHAIETLTQRIHGLVATMMASEVFSVDRTMSLKANAYSSVRRKVEAMDNERLSETAKGPAVDLVCVDHSSMGYLRPFYHDAEVESRLRGEGDFLDLTSRILNITVPEPHRAKVEYQDTRALAAILKELFSNTHDHARRDIDGKPYKKSVRGVHAAFHYVDPSRIDEVANGLPMLAAYLKQHISGWRGSYLQFVELSIFDSGPGLATKALRCPLAAIPLDKELDAVSSCFLKHVSSKARPTDGLGLYRTMGLLKARSGFMRLRTGRLSLYRAFAPDEPTPGKSELSPLDIQFADAASGERVPKEMAPAVGVVATILLPIGRARN